MYSGDQQATTFSGGATHMCSTRCSDSPATFAFQQRSSPMNLARFGARQNLCFLAVKAVLFAGEGGIEFSVNAVQHGARGLIIGRQAAAAEMAACIRRVHAGRICIPNEVLVEVLNAFSNVVPMAEEPDRIAALLSPREQEVRALVVQGM